MAHRVRNVKTRLASSVLLGLVFVII